MSIFKTQKKKSRELHSLTKGILISSKDARRVNIEQLLSGNVVKKVDETSNYETAVRASKIAKLVNSNSKVFITNKIFDKQKDQYIVGDVYYIQDNTAYFFLPKSFWKKQLNQLDFGFDYHNCVGKGYDKTYLNDTNFIENGRFLCYLSHLKLPPKKLEQLVNISISRPHIFTDKARRALHDYAIVNDPFTPRDLDIPFYCNAIANGQLINTKYKLGKMILQAKKSFQSYLENK